MTGTLYLVFTLMGGIRAQATLDKSGHVMLITYDIQGISKSDAIQRVDIWLHVRGESYRVASHRYPEPVTSISDTFPWFSKSKWQGGDLEVVFYGAEGSKVSRYIPETSIHVRDLSSLFPSPVPEEKSRTVNWGRVKTYDGSDPYAWRMLGYDPGHTGYYPFFLRPPLDSLWLYDWSGAGTWTTEISGAAGQGMIFIPEAPWGWNKIQARDIETGEVIWERYVTANAMTSALSIGDSILFVGTWIGFTPWKDTTFYALDPFTGDLKWGKVLKTVQYSPIVVDTFVYAPHFYKVYCFTYRGDSVWAGQGAYPSPVYEDGVIVGASTDSVLNARDYLTGELLWDFTGSRWIFTIMAYEEKAIFSRVADSLYALDIFSGDTIWKNESHPQLINAGYSRVYFGRGMYVGDTIFTLFAALDAEDGTRLWDTLLPPADTNGGRMSRIVISEDNLLWVPNVDIIYVLKANQPEVIYTKYLPKSPAIWPSGNFPIAYRDYFIYAHKAFVVVYQEANDIDVGESSWRSYGLRIYWQGMDRIVMSLRLYEGGWLSLGIWNVTGRRVYFVPETRMSAGKHQISIDLSGLSSGVYLLRGKVRGIRGVRGFGRKVLILK